ncbi:hypothetical protein [Streptomyces sp. NBC_01233]|uniref:hypothetical protein n=1 Tax=Streptomyces sp. NBC_01233 TaxID=2903787 RepID=UPI002E15A9C1|nr:hypothetical protein OG332_01160 [Streptomyces sp. NBC_01233]
MTLKEEFGIPDTCYADDIAARLSVDPGAPGPDTGIRGTGSSRSPHAAGNTVTLPGRCPCDASAARSPQPAARSLRSTRDAERRVGD